VSSENQAGTVYVAKGELIAAETGSLKGLEAAYAILSWDRPSIEIDYVPFEVETHIKTSLVNILMNAQRFKDEHLGAIIEMRQAPRYNCLVAVDYNINDWTYQNFVRNISLGGAFIETGEDIPLGQRILMVLTHPEDKSECTVAGKVVRKEPTGIGIKFEELNDQQRALVESILA
jgi:Tfp pilus assembly protein PilZ